MVGKSHALRTIRPADEEAVRLPVHTADLHLHAEEDTQLEVGVESEQFVRLARNPEHSMVGARGRSDEATGFPLVDVASLGEVAEDFESARFRAVDPTRKAALAQDCDSSSSPLAVEHLVTRRGAGQEDGALLFAVLGQFSVVVELDHRVRPHGLEFGQQRFVCDHITFLSIESGHVASSWLE